MKDNDLAEKAKQIYKQYIETEDKTLKEKLFWEFNELMRLEYLDRMCEMFADVRNIDLGDQMEFKLL